MTGKSQLRDFLKIPDQCPSKLRVIKNKEKFEKISQSKGIYRDVTAMKHGVLDGILEQKKYIRQKLRKSEKNYGLFNNNM